MEQQRMFVSHFETHQNYLRAWFRINSPENAPDSQTSIFFARNILTNRFSAPGTYFQNPRIYKNRRFGTWTPLPWPHQTTHAHISMYISTACPIYYCYLHAWYGGRASLSYPIVLIILIALFTLLIYRNWSWWWWWLQIYTYGTYGTWNLCRRQAVHVVHGLFVAVSSKAQQWSA